ncbi:GNAT family N-acetyltransferase [Streptomyces sp. NPDC046977]|uniref:GNAT family N-acetyltransferase n=1 Tax=Streptomyces sp. NPDC046977 TaxID=3154703 RepID=UPI0033DA8634
MDHGSEPAVELRAARPADLPRVFLWERLYMRTVEPANEARWTEAIDRQLELWISCLDRTLILEAEGEACGSMMWMPSGTGAVLVGIHVAPEHRRRGFGGLLLDAFAGQAREAGCDVLSLGVFVGNPAVHLYESRGYRPTGRDGDYLLFERPV